MTLTAAGELSLARARRVLGELDGARADLAELAAVVHGRVAIGSMAVLGAYDLPAALAGFHARYPGVSLALRSGLIAELLELLDSGAVDLRQLVSAGLGVALLARSAVDAAGPPVAVVELDPAPAHPPIGLIHHRDRRLSAAARCCRQELLRRA